MTAWGNDGRTRGERGGNEGGTRGDDGGATGERRGNEGGTTEERGGGEGREDDSFSKRGLYSSQLEVLHQTKAAPSDSVAVHVNLADEHKPGRSMTRPCNATLTTCYWECGDPQLSRSSS